MRLTGAISYDTLLTMSQRTIRCKLAPTPVMGSALAATCERFADACNAILVEALRRNEANNVRLHHLTYRTTRARFGLSANLVVRAIRRVAQAMTAAKKRGRPPAQFRPTSVDYDARIFDLREQDETVSLTTVSGRIHVPLVLGAYQRTGLRGKRPTAATLVRQARKWYIHIVVEDGDAPPAAPGGGAMGVDLGIRNTAATSFGALHSGAPRQDFKARCERVRASLQSKDTAGARRLLRRLSGYEQRRVGHENHVLSKALVEEAQRHGCEVIRMEQLRGIRQRTRTWNKHLNRMVAGWSFAQLQSFVAYKATRAGIAVEFIDPAFTSQTCSTCGQLGSRHGDRFVCTTCGEKHADSNAAVNIAAGGVAREGKPSRRKPARIRTGCEKSSHLLPESRLL